MDQDGDVLARVIGVADRRVVAVVGRDDQPVAGAVEQPRQLCEPRVDLLQDAPVAPRVLLVAREIGLLDVRDHEAALTAPYRRQRVFQHLPGRDGGAPYGGFARQDVGCLADESDREAGAGGEVGQLSGVVEVNAQMPHLEPAVAVETGGRGVQPDGAAVTVSYVRGERPVRVAPDGDDAGDRGDRPDRTGDGEDAVEGQVVQTAGGVPVDAGVGLQVVVDQHGTVDEQQRLPPQRLDEVSRGLQRAAHLVEMPGQRGHRDPAEVRSHHGLVSGEGVGAGVTESGPPRRDGAAGPAGEVRVRMDEAESQLPERGQPERPAQRRAAVVEDMPAGVGGEIAGPQRPRVRHRADTEPVDDDDHGRAHGSWLLTGPGPGRRRDRSTGVLRWRARRRPRRSSG